MTIFFVALVVTFSGFINSLTGFGFIIVAAPFLVQILPPKEAASVALVLGIILAGIVALRERKTIAIKTTLQMFAAALFGIPIGTAILVGVNPAAIKIIVGSIVVGVTLALARGLQLPSSRELPFSLAAGFLSGILSGVSGMSGAMAVIFFMSQGWTPERVRPTIAAFNTIVSIVTLSWLLSTGTIGRTECTFALMFLPAAVLGVADSGFLYKKIQARHFRPLTFMLVIIAGILAIIAGIRQLVW
jgi:uncharacterized membrane protein YfcA